MQEKSRFITMGILMFILLLTVRVVQAAPVGTAFTYQGRLDDNGQPADGYFDFQFRLFDAESGGIQVGVVVIKEDVPVSKGLFNVPDLDFGSGMFNGEARWLEIGVRPGAETGSFTVLSPLQPMTPTPYALYALNSPGGSGTGDITAVLPGVGLTGGGIAGDVTLNVNFGGMGSAATVSRSDHNHDATYVNVNGDSMSGNSSNPILSVSNTSMTSNAYGIHGSTASSANGVAGVRGSAGLPGVTIQGKQGVLGQSDTGIGVVGVSRDDYGTYGYSYNNWGIRGEGRSGGVSGYAFGASNSYGVYGIAGGGTGNYAGYFSGAVHVTGQLTKGSGAFKIDHPLDPQNKYLYHSFVESPEMMNIYIGNVVLSDGGKAWVQLPDWFEALNRDFRYQLTAIGGPGPNLYIAQKIQENRFQIAGGAPGLEVSWQVTGIRHDPYAETHRIPVEEDKPAQEKGTYLHPDAY